MLRLINEVYRKVNELTTTANIVFLPSGFVNFGRYLRTLARLKKKWNLEVLERSEAYEVNFEDKLKVLVERGYFPTFCKEFLGVDKYVSPRMVIDLENYLKEAVDRGMEEVFRELDGVVHRILVESPISEIDEDVRVWEGRFGVKRFITDEKSVVLRIENLEEDVKKLLDRIRKSYPDDRGMVEMIMEAFRSKRPLNAFDLFRGYRSLIASRIYSEYRRVGLIFDVEVSLAWMLSESIYISSSSVLDRLEEESGEVKIVKNAVFPIGRRFTRRFFGVLLNVIKEVV